MSLWHFKKGKREEAFVELDHVLNTSVRKSKGFRGYISLRSPDDPTLAKILTMWQDEESREASEKPLFDEATNKVKNILQGYPRIENYKIFSAVFPAEGEVKGSDLDLGEKFVTLKR